jgi:hypothetical protein
LIILIINSNIMSILNVLGTFNKIISIYIFAKLLVQFYVS